MTRPLRHAIASALVTAALLTAAPHADARETLSSARELYAAAAYTDALVVLDGLLALDPPREERQSIDLYRVLCLVALGRKGDADRAMESMIVRDPLYRPTGDDVPPRMRTAFVDARRRLLPAIIQAQYGDAKAAFDRKEYAAASRGFEQVLAALGDPDLGTLAAQSPLSDLRTLAQGFRDLSVKTVVPPPPAPVRAPQPVLAVPGRIYTADDADVVAPVTLRQSVPAYRGNVTTPLNGIAEVLIDTSGAVESVKMAVPTNGQYEALVLSAAKRWQYQPARVNGVPVKYLKRVKVTLTPAPK
jgi:hypothetical protein